MSPSPRNWLELPPEVTALIMSRLEKVDILTNVQFVCKSWLEISKEPLIWQRIDMYDIGDLYPEIDLAAICRRAVDRSSGMLVDISIDNFGDDELLEYIADRSKELKRLQVACCLELSVERMIGVIAKLPMLEELDLTRFPCSVEFVEAVGRWCPHLSSFKLNYQSERLGVLDRDGEAISIGKNMAGLRRLGLVRNTMTNAGLKAILAGCLGLEWLDLRGCAGLELDTPMWKTCAARVKRVRGPWQRLPRHRRVRLPEIPLTPLGELMLRDRLQG